MKCPQCGVENEADAIFCSDCGMALTSSAQGSATGYSSGLVHCWKCGEANNLGDTYCGSCGGALTASKVGSRSAVTVPEEIKGWNWGAFFLSWIWGIGNGVYISLLFFVPVVGFVMPFVLGAKGSKWAWQNKNWDSIDHFKRTQRTWAIIGVILFALNVFFFIAQIILFTTVAEDDFYW